ncbi:hypothetical protein FC83_GL002071 [Agrilactobacillus composti DSM 18527 = JCM 14202]|uniref:Uncharacterized protein n=2 Tax=Agrilactobacillus TaxID=2767875 RepID=A0A0R1XXZ8_9LACO|nr:hypothetical protein FC83_GL002071 [Agrilactobacillus composti DSM 18527 = JCM 14202]
MLLIIGIPGIFVDIMGIQFLRNKWLRLIAGNTFGDASKSETDRVRKPVGIFCIIIGFFMVVIGVVGWLGHLDDLIRLTSFL